MSIESKCPYQEACGFMRAVIEYEQRGHDLYKAHNSACGIDKDTCPRIAVEEGLVELDETDQKKFGVTPIGPTFRSEFEILSIGKETNSGSGNGHYINTDDESNLTDKQHQVYQGGYTSVRVKNDGDPPIET